VVFVSFATNLVTGDTNGVSDLFLRDRQAGTTERVDLTDAGAQADSGAFGPAVSHYGRYVAFGSFSSGVVSGDTNGAVDIFVRDRQAGTIA
jgi:Tol biopolymer transport system component